MWRRKWKPFFPDIIMPMGLLNGNDRFIQKYKDKSKRKRENKKSPKWLKNERRRREKKFARVHCLSFFSSSVSTRTCILKIQNLAIRPPTPRISITIAENQNVYEEVCQSHLFIFCLRSSSSFGSDMAVPNINNSVIYTRRLLCWDFVVGVNDSISLLSGSWKQDCIV